MYSTGTDWTSSSAWSQARIVLFEAKGAPDEKDDAKATAARRWVEAVNTWGGLGVWTHLITYDAVGVGAQLTVAAGSLPQDV